MPCSHKNQFAILSVSLPSHFTGGETIITHLTKSKSDKIDFPSDRNIRLIL